MRPPSACSDQEILRRLEKEKILVFTPSRRVQGRRVVCYDDRFIVKLAYESDGIIVSNDNYRDLANEKKNTVERKWKQNSMICKPFKPILNTIEHRKHYYILLFHGKTAGGTRCN